MDSELSLRKAQLLSSRGLGSVSLQGCPFPSASCEALTLQTLLELRLPPPPLALPGLGAFMSLQRDCCVFSLEVWVLLHLPCFLGELSVYAAGEDCSFERTGKGLLWG